MSRVVSKRALGVFRTEVRSRTGSLLAGYDTSDFVSSGYVLTRGDIVKSAFPPMMRPALPYKASLMQYGSVLLDYSFTNIVGGNVVTGYGEKVIRYSNDPALRPSSPRASITASMQNEALVRALGQLANIKWNAVVALVEGREAVTMIHKSATTIDRVLRSVQHGKYAAAARALGLSSTVVRNVKTAGGAWLALQFGWKPLVDDMAKAALAISDNVTLIRLRAGSHVRRKDSYIYPGDEISDPKSFLTWQTSHSVEEILESRVSLWYSLKSADAVRLREYGAANLPLALWAITPNSFLVDWVLPVSDILKAMGASFGLTYMSGSRTDYVETNHTLKGVVKPRAGAVINRSRCVTSDVGKLMTMDRVVFKNEPSPNLALYVKDPFDLWKGVTALSLLAQRKIK